MHDTFLTLLTDRAHWEFELFLQALFDGLLGAVLWPIAKHYWQKHHREEHSEVSKTRASRPDAPLPNCIFIKGNQNLMPGWGCCQCSTYNGLLREACKHCQHERCEPLLQEKEETVQ